MKTPQCAVFLGGCGLPQDVQQLTCLSDRLPLVGDCLGNGGQIVVLNRDTLCD